MNLTPEHDAIMGRSEQCLNTALAHVTRTDKVLPMPVRSLKYQLRPNQAQAAWLEGQLRECCDLYNAALEERRGAWKTCRKTVSFHEQSRQLKYLRAQGLIQIPNFLCAEEVLKRLDRSYKSLFRRGFGFPRFRSAKRYGSISFRKHGQGFSVKRDKLHLQGCSLIRINLHRPIEGKIKMATVKRESSRWFVILVCEVTAKPLPEVSGECGIDVGLSSFVAMSDGSTIAAPQLFRKAQVKLRRAQRHLARCKRGSKRRHKAVQRVARHHARVRNQRADFHHKLSRQIVNKNQFIAVEDLNVKGLARTRLAKSIHDAGWGSFISKLSYKAESAGRMLVKVNPRGTSQTCICGNHVPKKLSDRWHECAELMAHPECHGCRDYFGKPEATNTRTEMPPNEVKESKFFIKLAEIQQLEDRQERWRLKVNLLRDYLAASVQQEPLSAEQSWREWHDKTYGNSVEQYMEIDGWKKVAWKFAEYYATLKSTPAAPRTYLRMRRRKQL